jgi:hypothetical protein
MVGFVNRRFDKLKPKAYPKSPPLRLSPYQNNPSFGVYKRCLEHGFYSLAIMHHL